jgi:hypothetical protein
MLRLFLLKEKQERGENWEFFPTISAKSRQAWYGTNPPQSYYENKTKTEPGRGVGISTLT